MKTSPSATYEALGRGGRVHRRRNPRYPYLTARQLMESPCQQGSAPGLLPDRVWLKHLWIDNQGTRSGGRAASSNTQIGLFEQTPWVTIMIDWFSVTITAATVPVCWSISYLIWPWYMDRSLRYLNSSSWSRTTLKPWVSNPPFSGREVWPQIWRW